MQTLGLYRKTFNKPLEMFFSSKIFDLVYKNEINKIKELNLIKMKEFFIIIQKSFSNTT